MPGLAVPESLKGRLTLQLMVIALCVIGANVIFIALSDAADRPSLLIDLVRNELLRIEADLPPERDALEAWSIAYNGIYKDYPAAYAFAVLDGEARLIAGRNTAIIPPALLEPGGFSADWLAWPNGGNDVPVTGSHTVAGSDGALSLLLYIADDPAGLIEAEIANEFRGHVWLPILPIAFFLIGGTVFSLWRSMRPLEFAADWARNIRPGQPLPELAPTKQPSEVDNLVQAVNRTVLRLDEQIQAEQRRAAEATHALRTPVAVLVARMDALPDDRSEYRQLKRDVRALSRMVTQYLTSAGADRLEVTPSSKANLNRVARLAVQDLTTLAASKGVDLTLTLPPRDVVITGVEEGILLAVKNLIENAIHHGGPGRVDVQINEDATIAVRDQGLGLGEKTLSDLVRPFVRGLSVPSGGAGLGLSIVDRIQRAHGGRVDAFRLPGGITEFRLSYMIG